MSTNKRGAGNTGAADNGKAPVGVWNRGSGRGPANPIRVRTKRLDEIDGDKIALAYWLLAKRIVENGSDVHVTEDEAREVGSHVNDSGSAAKESSGRKRGGRS